VEPRYHVRMSGCDNSVEITVVYAAYNYRYVKSMMMCDCLSFDCECLSAPRIKYDDL